MKQKITLSIALVMSLVLISLIGSVSTANAAPPQRYVADTGVMTLGPNQVLRLTVAASRDVLPQDTFTLNFEEIKYGMDSSSLAEIKDDGDDNSSNASTGTPNCRPSHCACIHTITSRNRTGNMTLTSGQVASIETYRTPNSGVVRGLVYSSSPNIEVNAEVVDIITGATLISRHLKVIDGSNGG